MKPLLTPEEIYVIQNSWLAPAIVLSEDPKFPARHYGKKTSKRKNRK